MALRRDTHALTWPARAFLPARGTFVRRIEMLRNTKRISHASLPIAARLLTVGLLAALGLLVAGLRGPAGWSTAQAQTQPQVPAVDNPKTPASESYNLAFLPADAKMVVAVRPRTSAPAPRGSHAPGVDQAKSSLPTTAGRPRGGLDSSLLLGRNSSGTPSTWPESAGSVPFGSGLADVEASGVEAALESALGSPREVHHDGQTYLSTDDGPEHWGVFAPDDRTLVVAREDLLRELIEDRKAPAPRHPWDEVWNKVVKGQVMVALETRWLRRRIAQGLQGGPAARARTPADLKLETIAPLLEKAQSYAVGIDASEGLAVDLVAAAGSDDDAKPVAETMQALLTLARNAVEGMRQDRRGQPVAAAEAMEWSFQAAEFAPGEGPGRDIRGLRALASEIVCLTSPRESSSWRRPWRPRGSPPTAP